MCEYLLRQKSSGFIYKRRTKKKKKKQAYYPDTFKKDEGMIWAFSFCFKKKKAGYFTG